MPPVTVSVSLFPMIGSHLSVAEWWPEGNLMGSVRSDVVSVDPFNGLGSLVYRRWNPGMYSRHRATLSDGNGFKCGRILK